MANIGGSVGRGGMNAAADVMTVESLLMSHRSWLSPLPHMVPDGNCAPETVAAITKFQETAGALAADRVDGRVSPNGFTIRRLSVGHIPFPQSRMFLQQCWYRDPNELQPADYAAAAQSIGCEVEAIQAVVEQEVGIRGPWDTIGRPTLLFERHKFSKHTNKVWDNTHPDIANASSGGYGRYSAQFPKLYRAATLDETAALKSASWGAFQILGENHVQAGHATITAFVDAMLRDLKSQLNAFVSFVNNDDRLKRAITNRDWATFARIYNGPSYRENAYDTKMAAIYRRLTANRPR